MKRRLFKIATALSSVLFLTVCAVWMGNHSTVPTYAAMSHSPNEQYQPPRDTGLLVVPDGFYLMADQRIGAPKPWKWWVPYWLLLVILSVYPMGYAVAKVVYHRNRITKLRRRANGFCICCGYDLRASPDGCPECGVPQPPLIAAPILSDPTKAAGPHGGSNG